MLKRISLFTQLKTIFIRRRSFSWLFLSVFVLALSGARAFTAQPAFATSHTYEITPSSAIPDGTGCATGLWETINVPDTFNVGDVKVGLNIDHSLRSDLIVRVVSPAGTSVQLFRRVGGAVADIDAYFDDAAATDASSMTNAHNIASPYYDGGTYNPEGAATLSSFDGESANGNWQINVCDRQASDTGTLDRAQLIFEEAAASSTYSYSNNSVATIPDNSCGAPFTRTFSVADDFNVTDLDVGLKVTHESRRHLVVSLTSPMGTIVELHNGGLAGPYIDIDATFNQSAVTESSTDTANHDTTAPDYDVAWNPDSGSLDAFNGEPALGDWTISICDKQNTKTGTFTSAQLDFSGTPNATNNVFRGTVFDDVNYNGVNNSEAGVANVTVTAFAADGSVVDTTTTDSNGQFTLTGVTDGEEYRIEFTSLPAGFTPSPIGTDSNSQTRFATAPDLAINLGIYEPVDGIVCHDSTMRYVVSCFTNGDPTDASNATETAIARFDYLAAGTAQSMTSNYLNIAHLGDTGPVWGLAYDPNSGYLYSAAVVKRHTGAGPDGIGAIYRQTDISDAASVALFHDFGSAVGTIDNNATRFPGTGNAAGEEGPCAKCDNVDPNAFDWAAQRAFGDIDVSEDGSTLYVTNLFDRKLYMMNTGGVVSHSEVAGAPWLSNADCNDNADGSDSGIARPWAIKVHEGSVYVGVVCDASSSTSCDTASSCADLTAHVYAYNGSSWSTPMGSSPLTYTRDLYQSAAGAANVWHPWPSSYTSIASHLENIVDPSYPQPILGDIEFAADGHMILSFLDRSSLQFGYNAPGPNGVSSDITIKYLSSGDVLRATESGGSYTLQTTEFYDDQIFNTGASNPLSGTNDDSATGGIAYADGLDVAIQGISDVIDAFSAGVIFFSSADGTVNAAQEVFQGSNDPASEFFGKAGGLGDIEAICTINTYYVEVGNRVWFDSNSDGVQDADEAPLAGVVVELMAPDGVTVLGTATTDANGNYLFSSATNSTTGSAIYNIAALSADTTGFTIRINTSQPVLATYVAALSNNDGSPNGDVRDSDGVSNGNYVEVLFNTSSAGENNFSFDFGFMPSNPTAVSFSQGTSRGLLQSPIGITMMFVLIMVVSALLIVRKSRQAW